MGFERMTKINKYNKYNDASCEIRTGEVLLFVFI